MKILAPFLLTVLLLTGCYTPSGRVDPAGTALAGAALGAGTGALIGSASHHGGAGALIGGAVGLLTGALVGQSMEMEQQERLRREAPRTYERVEQGQPLGIADIKALSKAGVSDEIIISQIRASRTPFRLTTAEIIDLKEAGVSNKVIDFMISYTPPASRAATETIYREVIVPEPPPAPVVERVYVSPGPEFVWVGGYWGWGGGSWAWTSGRWCRPPYGHSVWVAPHCINRGGTSVWISGYWH